MKKFDFSSGKFLGGLAIIFFGVILLIENTESLPFVLIIFAIGFILIGLELKTYLLKNENQILNKCIQLIDEYEKPLPMGTVSCKTVLIERIKIALNKEKLLTDNIDKTCHIVLGNITFSLLASGEYHIYRGQLNILGMAPALHKVFIKSTKWLHDNGHITDEEYQNSIKNLNDAINEVG